MDTKNLKAADFINAARAAVLEADNLVIGFDEGGDPVYSPLHEVLLEVLIAAAVEHTGLSRVEVETLVYEIRSAEWRAIRARIDAPALELVVTSARLSS